MKILITGHRGYIGSHLFNNLKLQERELIGVDLKEGKNVLTAELPDVDFVFHMAAQAGAVPSIENPMWDAETNILSTIRILERYVDDETKIIYPASAAALNPKSPYGLSKRTAEDYIHMISPDNTVICRLSSIYGNKPVGVVDNFIREQNPVVYGDGTATRDFVHVDDIVRGLMKAMWWESGEYLMGSGKGTTIKELAEATGKEIRYEPARDGEVHTSVLINTTPNWKPEIDVIDYIESTLDDEEF